MLRESPKTPLNQKKAKRTSNPTEYVIQIEPEKWVFEGGNSSISFHSLELSTYASACSPDYMAWYMPRTYTKLQRMEDMSDEEENEDRFLSCTRTHIRCCKLSPDM